MAETLGSLCDKLTVVKLKQWHSDDREKLDSLAIQEKQLQCEINEFVSEALAGNIPMEKLTFATNKVFKSSGISIKNINGSVGELFANLASTNCRLWHEQEKVYEFENVPADEKNTVVKRLATLNLERTCSIDEIDRRFSELVKLYFR